MLSYRKRGSSLVGFVLFVLVHWVLTRIRCYERLDMSISAAGRTSREAFGAPSRAADEEYAAYGCVEPESLPVGLCDGLRGG